MIEYKKSSAVLVVNNDGEVALQLRASNDDSFPLHWDFSAGGGIDEGEEEEVAAKRELQEELGIKADVEFIAKEHFTYPAWKPGVAREVDLWRYKTHHNGPFKPDMEEIERVEFFSLDKIEEMIKSGAKFHPEFLMSWEKGLMGQAVSG